LRLVVRNIDGYVKRLAGTIERKLATHSVSVVIEQLHRRSGGVIGRAQGQILVLSRIDAGLRYANQPVIRAGIVVRDGGYFSRRLVGFHISDAEGIVGRIEYLVEAQVGLRKLRHGASRHSGIVHLIGIDGDVRRRDRVIGVEVEAIVREISALFRNDASELVSAGSPSCVRPGAHGKDAFLAGYACCQV
jgi:hypothetical protein